MPTYAQAIAAMGDTLKKGMAPALTPQLVTPYGGGTPVTVSLFVGKRRTGSPDLTGAIDQQLTLATIDADDWDLKVGRMPQRGDVITWAGLRYAVDDCQIASFNGTDRTFYTARIQG